MAIQTKDYYQLSLVNVSPHTICKIVLIKKFKPNKIRIKK